LNKHIKENLSNFEVPQIRTASKKRTHLSLAKKVEAKVADFNIRGAIKLLSSDDSLASFNEGVAIKKNILHHLANFFPRRFQTRRLFFNTYSMSKTFEKLSIPVLLVLYQV
jgi:hypothetical protein